MKRPFYEKLITWCGTVGLDANQPVRAWELNGTWHGNEYCRGVYQHNCRLLPTPFTELVRSEKVCSECFNKRYFSDEYARGLLALYGCARDIEREVKDTDLSKIIAQTRKLRKAREVLRRYAKEPHLASVVSEMLQQCETALEESETEESTDYTRLERDIKKKIGLIVDGDTSPMLVGITHASSTGGPLWEAAVRAYLVREHSWLLVLCVPTWVVPWLMRHTANSGSAAPQILVLEPGDDPYTIAQLWDPRGTGPFVSLVHCRESSQLLAAS